MPSGRSECPRGIILQWIYSRPLSNLSPLSPPIIRRFSHYRIDSNGKRHQSKSLFNRRRSIHSSTNECVVKTSEVPSPHTWISPLPSFLPFHRHVPFHPWYHPYAISLPITHNKGIIQLEKELRGTHIIIHCLPSLFLNLSILLMLFPFYHSNESFLKHDNSSLFNNHLILTSCKAVNRIYSFQTLSCLLLLVY